MKKLLFILSGVLFALLPARMAAYDFVVDGIYYNANDSTGTAAVTFRSTSYNSYSGDVVIPESVTNDGKTYQVTEVGEYAFRDCKNLTSVTIPNSISSMGTYAFYKSEALTRVNISNLEAWCGINFGNYLANPLNYAHHLFLNGSEIIDLEIPESITTIQNNAFSGCSELRSVTMGNSVTSIGSFAFAYCTGLTSFSIPDSVRTLGGHVLYDCSKLASVYVGKSVVSIGEYAFTGCDALARVDISDIEAWCRIVFEGLSSNPLYFAPHLFLNGQEVDVLVIPSGIISQKWLITI